MVLIENPSVTLLACSKVEGLLEARHMWDFAPMWNSPGSEITPFYEETSVSSHTFYQRGNFTPEWFHLGLRAPSHVKFCPCVKFPILIRVEKNWCHTWVSTRGQINIFILHFTLGWKYICKGLRHILQKCFMEKNVSYSITGLYKNYDVRFHQQEKYDV